MIKALLIAVITKIVSRGFLGLLLLVVLFSHASHAQNVITDTKLQPVNYGKSEGLIPKSIGAMVQDKEGYLIIGTSDGIWKYNGSEFYRILTKREGLSSNSVFNLLIDKENAIWAGTPNGINKIVDEKVVLVIKKGTAFWGGGVEDDDGSLWYTFNSGIIKISNDKIVKTYGKKDGIERGGYRIRKDKYNNIWVGSSAGLYKISNEKVKKHYTADDGLTSSRLIEIFEDDNTIWAGDGNGNFNQMEINTGKILQQITPKQGLIEPAMIDKNKNLWFGSSEDLMHYKDGKTTIYKKENGLAGGFISALYEDRDNNIWVGTSSGLSKISKEKLTSSYSKQSVFAQIIDDKGDIWLATPIGLKYLINNKIVKIYTVDDGLLSNNIKSVMQDQQKRIWVGTTKGISVIEDNKIVAQYSVREELQNNEIYSLYQDLYGKIWIGTNNGLAVIKEGKIKAVFKQDIFQTRIEAIMGDDSNNIWIGTKHNGLIVLNAEKIEIEKVFTKGGLEGFGIRGITKDKDNNIWVASYGAGVVKFSNKKIVKIFKQGTDIESVPRSITSDDNGNIWVGHDGFGLTSIVAGKALKNYRYDDGILNSIVYSVNTDSNGDVLVGTGEGLILLKPQHRNLDLRFDKITVETKDENGNVFEVTQAISDDGIVRLPYGKKIINFRYSSLDYEVKNKHFLTMLENFDDNWQDVGTKSSRQYMNLSSGKYTFKIKVQNFDGTWNPNIVSAAIIIIPPWWMTLWFKLFIVIVMLSVFFVLYKIRIFSLKKSNLKLEKRVEERTIQLKKAKEEAEIANQAKSEFLANMSHDIRTPMNAILGFAEIMNGKISDPKLTHYLESIHSSGKSLLTLINDILDLSKVEAGRLELQYDAVSSQDLFNEMKVVFGQNIEDKGLNLIIDIPPDLPKSLILDDTRIRQILINLIGNSLKFTESGYIKLSIRYSYSGEIKHSTLDFLFSVEDTGMGIPDNQQESIFGVFSQITGQKTSKFGGTGLGLAITKKLVEMMGGEITVNSEVGKGSTFKVLLKGVEVASREAVASQQDKKIDFASIKFDKSTILIADDIDFNRELLGGFLEGYGFEIVEVDNGRAAIDKVKEHHPDLILMDMKMPEMDGYEASNIIKKDEELKRIPIIAVTASAMKEDEEIIKALYDGYLRKPISKTDLILELIKFLPHSGGNEIQIEAVAEEGASLSLTSLKQLPELFEILINKQELLKKLIEQLPIDGIEKFAQEIIGLGNKYHCQVLTAWGEQLAVAAFLFDIDQIQKLFLDLQNVLQE